MTDTPKPGDIHGHPIMECSDVRHAASRVHNHDNPISVSTTDDWDECSCPIQFVRPEPTPEPWAGHPIKWCEEHYHAASPGSSHCSFQQGREYVGDRPHFCTFVAWQPWVDLLAERDEARKELVALRVLDGAPAGRAEGERDEARREAIEALRGAADFIEGRAIDDSLSVIGPDGKWATLTVGEWLSERADRIEQFRLSLMWEATSE